MTSLSKIKMKLTGYLSYIISLFILPGVVSSCTTSGGNELEKGKEIKLSYAENLKIEDFDGYTKIVLRNPWDTTKILQRLVLVEKDADIPTLSEGESLISVPLENTVVFSSIHNSLIEELGRATAVKGICDVPYIKDEKVTQRLSEGELVNCGSSMTPNFERIVKLAPDAILLSPYETGGVEGKFVKAGIPVVECPDYMESSPLGRAEWIKFFARLYGETEKGDSLFAETEKRYLKLKEAAAASDKKPKVLFDTMYGGSWSVPGGKSTIGKLIEDAGGINPFSYADVSGSLNLSLEKVLFEGGDSDVWFIRHAGRALTRSELLKEKQGYGEIKAFKEGEVYITDTTESGIFEDFAFHPDYLLSDLIELLHPASETKAVKHYFRKVKD